MERPVRRILLVRTDKIGDILVSTPLFRSVHELYPEATISAWIHPGVEPILKHNPVVSHITKTTYKPGPADCWRLYRELRKERYDIVIFLRPINGLGTLIPLVWLARLPVRIGSVRKWYGRLLTVNVGGEDLESSHTTERMYRTIEVGLGKTLPRLPLELHTGDEDEREAYELVAGIGPYFIVHPGTGGTAHRWSPSAYGEVAKRIIANTGYRCLVTGTQQEAPLAQEVAQLAGEGASSIAGQTSILSLAAVLRQAKLVLAGSTGTMHMAASVQAPVVLVEPTPNASENIAIWRPWMVPNRSIGATDVCEGCGSGDCHQNGRACLDSISIDEVTAQAIELVRATAQNPVAIHAERL